MTHFFNSLNIFRPRRNAKFYSGKLKAKPSQERLDDIHSQWFAQFDFLEKNNNYMEWLFPIYGSAGNNPHTQALTQDEAVFIRNDKKCSFRFVKSYKLMLNFFGMKLENEMTGKISREEELWQSRYCHMNSVTNTTNKISRMLKSMYQLGFERYQKKFVEFIGEEMESHGLLGNLKDYHEKNWKTFVKGSNIGTPESVYFQCVAAADETYGAYKDAEQAFLAAKAQTLKELYQSQKQKTDLKKLYCNDTQSKSVDATSFFKRHYNSDQEEQEARIQFLENIKKNSSQSQGKKASFVGDSAITS